MITWKCKECGQEVVAETKPVFHWSDDHKCDFQSPREVLESDIAYWIDHPYAWPGGYEKVLLIGSDMAAICHKCFPESRDEILAFDHDDWHPYGVGMIWEGDCCCVQCGRNITVYGETENV